MPDGYPILKDNINPLVKEVLPSEVSHDAPNVFREVSSVEEKAAAPVVGVTTVCTYCGFNAHRMAGEKVILTQNYIESYLLPVYKMPCPNCGQNQFQTECEKA